MFWSLDYSSDYKHLFSRQQAVCCDLRGLCYNHVYFFSVFHIDKAIIKMCLLASAVFSPKKNVKPYSQKIVK